MHIDSYDFGHIVVDGVSYKNDLLIWPGRIKADWWRQEAHLLQAGDPPKPWLPAPKSWWWAWVSPAACRWTWS
jgi:hypothetical protein